MKVLRLLLVFLFVPALFLLMPGVVQATISYYPTWNYYDGYVWMANTTGGGYQAVHDAEDADCADYAGTYALVGQKHIPGDGYEIYRGILQFDTSSIPAFANIINASVWLYGHEDNSATNFNIDLVRGAEVNSPIVISDYGVLEDETTVRSNLFGSADWRTDQYNALVLNSAGRNDIVKQGITKFGVRSREDSTASAPTGDEYVSYWTSERGVGFWPYLEVRYDEVALGRPDKEFSVLAPLVFSDCLEADDQLYVFKYRVEYSTGEPEVGPTEYFYMQLLDDLGTIQAQNTLPAWGYRPGSFYLSASDALPWGTSGYQIRIIANDKMFSVTHSTTTDIEDNDWIGGNLEILDDWVLAGAGVMGNYYGEGVEGWEGYKIDIGGTTKLNDTGRAVFLRGIPYLDNLRPNLFASVEEDYAWSEKGEHDPTFESSMDAHLGTTLSNSFDRFGNIFNVSGEIVGTGLWLLLMVGVAGAITLTTKDFTGGAICAAPLGLIGFYLGMLPFIILALVLVILSGFLFRFVWLRYG